MAAGLVFAVYASDRDLVSAAVLFIEEQIARLAVQELADARERIETDSLHLALFQQ